MTRTGWLNGASIDIQVENHGSLFLLRPNTPRGKFWLHDNLDQDGPVLGTAHAVEPRYVPDIIAGALDAGLRVA